MMRLAANTWNELLYIIDICASSRGGMTDFLMGNHYYYYIVLFSLLSALLYADKRKIVYHIYWYLHTVCVTSPARQKKYLKYYCPCWCSSVYDLTLLQFILFYVIMQVSVRLTWEIVISCLLTPLSSLGLKYKWWKVRLSDYLLADFTLYNFITLNDDYDSQECKLSLHSVNTL